MKFLAILLLIFHPFLFSAKTFAQCKDCNELDSSKYLGIKSSKQYIKKKGRIKVFKNESKALKAGYQKFNSCNLLQLRKKTKNCQPTYGIITDKTYLCPKQLRGFSSESKAIAKGYDAFTRCNQATPTPTATPAVSPIPSTKSFVIENGNRFTDVSNITVLLKQDLSFMAYTSSSIDSLENLKYSTSADGLTFTPQAFISGITPDTSITFTNPSALLLSSGKTVLLYESINSAVTGGVFISSVLRAESDDGINFSQVPDSVTLPQGAGVSLIFEPSLLKIDDSTVRTYYTYSQSLLSATSTDNGVSWTAEGEVVILGRGDDYAPFLGSVSIVKLPDNSYLMFFSSVPDINSEKSTIFSAESTDGRIFTVHNNAVLLPPNGSSYTSPEAIILPNGSIRLYFTEYTGELGNISKNVLSALEQ